MQIIIKQRVIQLLSMLLLIGLCLPLYGGDEGEDSWAQFRGPARDGISNSKNLLQSWPDDGPREIWRKPLGTGFSGFAVDGDRFYTLFAEDSTEFLGCYNQADAEELWRFELGKMFVDEFGNGPRSTPVIDGNTIYALGSMGFLYSIDKNDGKSSWQVSFPEMFESTVPRRGFSMSPLIDGDRLIVEVGGLVQPQDSIFNSNIAAFSKKDGSLLWKHNINPGGTGYSSPMIITANDVRQYLFHTSRQAIGVSMDGEILWRHSTLPFVVGMPVFIAPNKVFISSATDEGCVMFRIINDSDSIRTEEVWANRDMKNHFNSTLAVNGKLYGFSNATLKCIDAETGKTHWRKRGLGKGSLIATDTHLYVLSDKGKLVLVEANPDAYTEVSRFPALKGKSWTAPTLVGGKIYLRNLTEMACFDLNATLNQ